MEVTLRDREQAHSFFRDHFARAPAPPTVKDSTAPRFHLSSSCRGSRGLRRSSLVALVGLAWVTASGCSLKPPGPVVTTVPVPSASDGGELIVSTESTTQLEDVRKKSETCPQGHTTGSPDCIVTHYTVKEPVTRTKTTMALGSQPLTHAQFLVLAEADRPERIAMLEDKTNKCKRAKVPRYVAIGLGIGAAIAGGYAIYSQNKIGTYVGIGLGAGALTSAGVGFGMSKGSCSSARDLARDLDLSGKEEQTVVPGKQAASELQGLAQEHNQR